MTSSLKSIVYLVIKTPQKLSNFWGAVHFPCGFFIYYHLAVEFIIAFIAKFGIKAFIIESAAI